MAEPSSSPGRRLCTVSVHSFHFEMKRFQFIVKNDGDVFVIEPGMKGTWEVVETVRKYFVFA